MSLPQVYGGELNMLPIEQLIHIEDVVKGQRSGSQANTGSGI